MAHLPQKNASQVPDRIDKSAACFAPFIPSYKMSTSDKQRYFTENKTSMIDYPRGIPEIEKYLVTMTDEKDPIGMMTSNYKEVSEIIQEVSDYIK